MKHFHVPINVLQNVHTLDNKLITKVQAIRKILSKVAERETGVKLTMPSVLKVQHKLRGLKAKSHMTI